MQLPEKIPGLKLFAVLVAIYAVVWISLEGSMVRVLLFSLGLSILIFGYSYQRCLGGRQISSRIWLLISAVAGLFLGLGVGLLSLFLMAVKTGLHGHGPEFSPEQINWMVQNIPIWCVVGLIAGLGLGLITAGFNGNRKRP